MSSIEQKPGQDGQFSGLDTTTAPLQQTPGSLTAADNIVIRRNSLIESRAGLQEMVQTPVRLLPTDTPYVPTNFWVDPYKTGTLTAPRVLNTFAFDTNPAPAAYTGIYTGYHYIASAVNTGVASATFGSRLAQRSVTLADSAFASDLDKRKALTITDATGAFINWWGQDVQFGKLSDIGANRTAGSIEPRVVQYYYATSSGPALILEQPQTFTAHQPDPTKPVGASYTFASVPLGVSEVPYVEVNSFVDSNSETGFWKSSSKVSTFAYRALYKQGDRFGAPSPQEIAVTSILTWKPNTISKQNATTMRWEFGAAPPAIAVGTRFVIASVNDSTKAVWVGAYQVTANGGTYIDFAVPSTNTANVGETLLLTAITEYKVAVFPYIWVYRDPYLSGSMNAPLNSGDIILYRTKQVTQDTGVGATDPGDEMFEVSRVTAVTPYDGTTKSWANGGTRNNTGNYKNMVVFADDVRDTSLGDFLYTNPSQEGITKANNKPPLCTIAETFAQTMFWSAVTDVPSIEFDLIGFNYLDDATKTLLRFFVPTELGSPDVYWEFQQGATEASDLSTNPGYPKGFTMTYLDDATMLPADRIEYVARSLVRVINQSATIPCTAQYVSGWQDNPGKIVLTNFIYKNNWLQGKFNQTIKTSQDVSKQSTYSYKYNVSTVTDPAYKQYVGNNGQVNLGLNENTGVKDGSNSAVTRTIVTALGYTVTDNVPVIAAVIKPVPNRIMYSKPQIAHAVPLLNFIDLPLGVTILALRATSGRLNIITDKGLWELTGSDESDFNLRERDVGVRCWAPGAVNVINDNLFVLTEQGVRVYGDGTLISRSVDSLILPVRDLIVNSKADLTVSGHLVTSAVDEYYSEYLLAIPDLEAGGNHILRFNANTKAWTVSKRDVTGMFFHPDYKRVVYGLRDGTVAIERRADRAFSAGDELYEISGVELGSSSDRGDGTWETNGNILDASLFTLVTGADGKVTRVGNPSKKVSTSDHIYWEHYTNGVCDSFRIVKLLSIVEDSTNGKETYITDAAIPSGAGYRVWLAKALPVEVEFVPFRGQSASTRKKWTELQLHLRGNRNGDILLTTSTDEQRGHKSVLLANPHYTRGFGTYPFGRRPFGDPTTDDNTALRTYVPQPHNSSRALTVNLQTSGFNQDLTLQGISAVFHDQSGKVGR